MLKEPSPIKNILYITTQLTGTWRYFSWCTYPNIWYARIQKRILDLLNHTEHTNIYIKFYSNDLIENPNILYSQQLSNKKVINKPLLDILKEHDFDLIITEASATTLLEILCTTAQILVFIPIDFIRLFSKAKKILKKRIFLAEKEEDYYKILKDLLSKSSSIEFKPINDEFLFLFGIGSPDKNSEELSLSALKSILTNEGNLYETIKKDP